MTADYIEIEPVQRPRFRRLFPTFAASFSAALGSLSLGSVIGYTSPAVPDINTQPGNYFHLNTVEIAWVAGIISLGGLLGGPIGGRLADRFGRKATILCSGVPYVLGWGLMSIAPNVYALCVGRFMTGFCAGVIDVTVPIYISEISEAASRGLLGSTHELCTNFGYLFVFTLGCFLHWRWLAVACMAVPLLMSVLMMTMPESPRWLLTQRGTDQATAALQWLRGPLADVSGEVGEIQENVRLANLQPPYTVVDCLKPVLYKPLLIIIGLMFFQQFSGYGAIPEYLVAIFVSSGSKWDPYLQTAMVGLMGVVANIFSAFLVDRCGRRIMLTWSATIIALGVGGLAAFSFVRRYDPVFDIGPLMFMPTLCLLAFNFGVALGYGPIPFYMAGELFPLRARGLAGGIAISSVWIFQFLTSASFPACIELVGYHGIYMIQTGFALLGILFAIFFVPETKGKTLEQIEADFGNGIKK